MKALTRFLLISLIVFVATLLRFWQLGFVPSSPDWDEVALGYNAYSIMLTGKDEYGENLPFILRSFDDYKPGLYAYFVIPFIKFLGLSVEVVRWPSALFGVLTVLATYFLLKELIAINPKSEIRNPKQIQNSNDQNSRNLTLTSHIPLLTSFLLAISPWHIQFSRIAFESNVGLAFNVFTALFLVKGFKNPLFIILATIFAGTNLYIYQGEKVFTPLLVFALILIFRKEVFTTSKKILATAVILGILISLPLILDTVTNKETLSRAKGVSVFSDQTQLLSDNAKKLIDDAERKDYIGLILDNRRVIFAKSVISGYLSHFDLNWLFITGDIARHHAPFMGLLYLWELPFLLVGIYSLILGNFDRKIKLFIFSWFLIAPIPASITSGVPHAVRTLNFLPTFQIFIAMGIVTTISNFKFHPFGMLRTRISNFKIKYFIFALCILFFIFNFLYFLNQYFIQQNYFHSQFWQYGYKQAVEEVKKREHLYDKIIVSNQPHLDQSYMFFLFYLRYPPDKYQQESKGASGGFRETHRFGKYEFRQILWDKEEKGKRFLYVGRRDDFPSVYPKVLKYINFLNKELAIMIVEG